MTHYRAKIWYKYGTDLYNKVEIAFRFRHNWAYEQEFVFCSLFPPFIVAKAYMD